MDCPICGEPVIRGECSSCGYRVDTATDSFDEDSVATKAVSFDFDSDNSESVDNPESVDNFDMPKNNKCNTVYLGWRWIGIAIDNVVSRFIFTYLDSNNHAQVSERNKLRRYGETTMADKLLNIKLIITFVVVLFVSTIPLLGLIIEFCGWRYAAYLSAYSRSKKLSQQEYSARIMSIVCGVIFGLRLIITLFG